MEQNAPGAFLYCAAVGVTAGVALSLLLPVSAAVLLTGIGVALGLITFGVLTGDKKMFLAAVVLAAVSLGVLRTETFLTSQATQSLLPFVGSGTSVAGVVVDDPERRSSSLHITVEVRSISDIATKGKLLAILKPDESVAYGDTVVLKGNIVEPQPFETNTGHVFDYTGYLQVQGISVMMPHAVLVSRTAGSLSLQTFLFSLKHIFEHSIETIFPEPDGSLLEGILLGERRGIPASLTQAFVASSLVHVVVLSGHNITIVSEGVFRALAFLPRTASYATGGALMILFALMTGAGATTVRALIMALIALWARYLHRSALALRSLAVAAAGMVLWNPVALLHDSSFILSMLATFGLITLAPWIEKKISRVPNYKRFDLRSIVATTVAVELFVTPALLYFNGTLSFLGLPANILALPVIPFAMLSGFIAGLVGLLNPAFALLPAIVCDVLLKWMMLVATTTKSLPFSTATVAQFPAVILFVVYVPLVLFSISRYRSDAQSHPN